MFFFSMPLSHIPPLSIYTRTHTTHTKIMMEGTTLAAPPPPLQEADTDTDTHTHTQEESEEGVTSSVLHHLDSSLSTSNAPTGVCVCVHMRVYKSKEHVCVCVCSLSPSSPQKYSL